MAQKRKQPESKPPSLSTLRRQVNISRANAELAGWRQIEASYKGGVPTRTSETWGRSTGYRFGTESDRQMLGSARDRAYNAYRNNPVARTLVDTETDNVIGDGLNYQPITDSEEWNREAIDRYYDWLERCSVRGGDIISGCEIQRMLWSRGRVAGDIGWILVSRGADSLVQIVPSETIVTPDGKYGQPGIYDGIQFDSFGRPQTFYVLSADERGKRDFIPIPANDFVFLSFMTEPTQARGETCYLTIFDLLANLDRYIDGVSLAAWMATVFGIVFKQQNGAKQLSQLPTLTNSQGNQQRGLTLENGMVKYIGTDEEVAQVQATQPMNQTPEFIRTMYRMLGQPFDMPLEVIAKDMSSCTFASARIGLLPFYRACRIKAARFGSRWSRTIRWWLSRERHRAKDDPKRWKSAWPENYWAHDLLVNAWQYTSPVDEAQGDLLEMSMLTKSPQMVISERGRDAQKIINDWQEWNDRAAGLPLVRSNYTRDPMPAAAEPTEPTKPEDDNEQSSTSTNGDGRTDVVRR